MAGYVYIVTNHKKGTLYIGVTSDLEGRIYEHREGLTPGFASRYGCTPDYFETVVRGAVGSGSQVLTVGAALDELRT